MMCRDSAASQAAAADTQHPLPRRDNLFDTVWIDPEAQPALELPLQPSVSTSSAAHRNLVASQLEAQQFGSQDSNDHVRSRELHDLESRLSETQQQLLEARDEAASAGLAAAQLQWQLDQARELLHQFASDRAPEVQKSGRPEFKGTEAFSDELERNEMTAAPQLMLPEASDASASLVEPESSSAEPQREMSDQPDTAAASHEAGHQLVKAAEPDMQLQGQIDLLEARLEEAQRDLARAETMQQASEAAEIQIQELQAELADSQKLCSSLGLELEIQRQLSQQGFISSDLETAEEVCISLDT